MEYKLEVHGRPSPEDLAALTTHKEVYIEKWDAYLHHRSIDDVALERQVLERVARRIPDVYTARILPPMPNFEGGRSGTQLVAIRNGIAATVTMLHLDLLRVPWFLLNQPNNKFTQRGTRGLEYEVPERGMLWWRKSAHTATRNVPIYEEKDATAGFFSGHSTPLREREAQMFLDAFQKEGFGAMLHHYEPSRSREERRHAPSRSSEKRDDGSGLLAGLIIGSVIGSDS